MAVSGQTTSSAYDGDGNLVKKTKPDGSRTIYPSTGLRAGVGGLYEVDKNSGGAVTKTTVYYPAAGALRVNGTLYYVLNDHLGSASVVTDSSGYVVGEQRYYPFGETRLSTSTMYTDKLFTGQREMTGLGIYHYGARFYSPKLGRFLSADTIVPNPANPQDFNRYSYVRNNPVRYTDPSGNIPIDCYNDPSYCSNTTTLPSSPYPAPQLPAGGGGGGGGNNNNNGGNSCSGPNPSVVCLPTPTPQPDLPTTLPTITTSTPNQEQPSFFESYCGDISWLACGGMLTQDGATLIDLVGVGLIEAPAVAMGCIEGGPLGCVIAEVGVIVTWNITLNNAEFYASTASLALTLADDLLYNGGLGENSATSLATWATGLLPLPPSWDLAVDTYASGYNHGFFNGVNTIWTDGLIR